MDTAQVMPADLGQAIEAYQLACDVFGRGDPEPFKRLCSHADDICLANPFGPPVGGWEGVSSALHYASSRFRDGGVTSFERVTQFFAPELSVILELEHWFARVAGRAAITPWDLRATTVFRREGGEWKVVLRHADPITTHDPDGPLRGSGQ